MTKQYNKMKVLRAMCIFSTTQGGLSKADYDNLRRVFIMNYGYQEMVTLMNLSDAGLFKLKDKKSTGYFDWNWQRIKD
jgi:vacuolar protein sorting-associated protein 33B